VQCSGSKSGWVIAKWRAGLHFRVEARDFIVEIVGNRVQRDADGEIRLATSVFPAQSVPWFRRFRIFTKPTESTSYTPLVSG